MSTQIPAIVEEYLTLVESGPHPVCRDQRQLAALIRKTFAEEDLVVELGQLERYLSLQKYFTFDLFPWEKFLLCLWDCTYTTGGLPRWPFLFCMVARGSGKDGFIAFDAACNVSPYNPVSHYNVDICANNEDQATQPIKDLIEVLELPAQQSKLTRHYYHTKELVQGRKNKGVVLGHTNNPKGRDGLRSGKVIFNEVHVFQNYDNITVFTTGLGKKAHPRRGVLTSNGRVNDGPLDDYLKDAEAILAGDQPDGGMLPFVCRLDTAEEVDSEENWYKASPSLAYLPHLLQETRDEYKEWKDHPERAYDFLPKRMGIRVGFQEMAVTDYEKLLATNKPLPDLARRSCTVGIDYAELSDWAGINLHFRDGDRRYDVNHAWVCAQSKTLNRVKAPWRAWADQGMLTVVEDVTINPELLADYILEAGKIYNIKMLAMDHYRWTLVSQAMKRAGFDAADKKRVKLVRPSDIMQVDPVIQTCFDRDLFAWGNNPMLRWACNNARRLPSSAKIGSSTGNFYYAKIEPKSRKTDPWMALVHSMVAEPVLGSGGAVTLPPMGAIRLG